jgi:RNA polymerase sigma factor (sigma-70 family)
VSGELVSSTHSDESCQFLIAQFVNQTGDKGAQLISVLRQYIRFCHYKMQVLSTEDQQELLQDIALKLLECPIPTKHCNAWLFTLVRNQYIDFLRHHSHTTRIFEPDSDGVLQEIHAPLVPTHENLYLEMDCLERVFQVIEQQATGAMDMLIYEHYALGRSNAEIAQLTERTESAIGKRISLLRERVRQLRATLC